MFDTNRHGFGAKEWSEHSVNIQIGCANACIYCYAAHNANRFNLRPRSEWAMEEFTKRSAMTSYPARDGVVMFPSSHDITPFNVNEYIRVARLILSRGNRLLIVSKPRLDCIREVISKLAEWKSQIMLRFTIGSMNSDTCAFWEPGAPSPQERISCLQEAYSEGFRTSVSIEPMLGGINAAISVVDAAAPFVTDTIWIGKMNKARLRVPAEYAYAVDSIVMLQGDERIMALHRRYSDCPVIRWKDSIKEVVARHGN
ncbi:radical SAM protein [Oryzomonas rubra]|uniref:Radical SAM protein n=1 Tax=Oryzomonas rubra TaxID=2509454 RepID=A0A5A9X7M4_9BACT|nr:radical SAM protein [Oryzomonas rubra]KAA0888794.1 hypothetical protein ET418_15555 [Oryzomonas rubra]